MTKKRGTEPPGEPDVTGKAGGAPSETPSASPNPHPAPDSGHSPKPVLERSARFSILLERKASYDELHALVEELEAALTRGEISRAELERCTNSPWGLDRAARYIGERLKLVESSLEERVTRVRHEWRLLDQPIRKEDTRIFLYEAIKSYQALLIESSATADAAVLRGHAALLLDQIRTGLIKRGWDSGNHIRGRLGEIEALFSSHEVVVHSPQTSDPDRYHTPEHPVAVDPPRPSLRQRLENSFEWVACGIAVAAFVAGSGAYIAIQTWTDRICVQKDSVVAKSEIDKIYVAKATVASDYVSKTEAAKLAAGSGVPLSPELSTFLQEASRTKPYAILSVTENVYITDTPPRRPVRRTASIRIVYSLFCFRKVDKEERLFKEGISGSHARSLGWGGTNDERALVNISDYDVSIECDAGDIITLETGNDLVYELPRTEDISKLGFTVAKDDANIEFWTYPAEEDYIWSVTIVAESNVSLVPVPDGLRRADPRGAVSSTTHSDSMPRRKERQRAVVGHWSKLKPAEQVLLGWKVDRSVELPR